MLICFRVKTPDEMSTPAPSETASWCSEKPDMASIEEPMEEEPEEEKEPEKIESEIEKEIETEVEEEMALPKTPTIDLDEESEDETVLAKRKELLSEHDMFASSSSSPTSQPSPPQLSLPDIEEKKVQPVVTKPGKISIYQSGRIIKS